MLNIAIQITCKESITLQLPKFVILILPPLRLFLKKYLLKFNILLKIYKIGRLELRNGELFWKLPISYTNNQENEKIDQSIFESSRMQNDRYSKDTRKSRLTQ